MVAYMQYSIIIYALFFSSNRELDPSFLVLASYTILRTFSCHSNHNLLTFGYANTHLLRLVKISMAVTVDLIHVIFLVPTVGKPEAAF